MREVRDLMVAELGYAPTEETIRSWHNGQVDPEKIAVEYVAALATIYRTSIRRLSPIHAGRLHAASDLLARTPACLTGDSYLLAS